MQRSRGCRGLTEMRERVYLMQDIQKKIEKNQLEVLFFRQLKMRSPCSSMICLPLTMAKATASSLLG